jgi:hypothetical protein
MEVTMTGLKTGDPVVLVDASGLEEHDLTNGEKGWVNSLTVVPGHGTYIFFMSESSKSIFVLDAVRLEYDKDREGLELNENTISKE